MPVKIVDDTNVIKPQAKYRVTCESCNAVIEYLGYDVAYHRNFPKGFVYCPNCNRPIAHKEENRCEQDATPEELAEAKKTAETIPYVPVILIAVILIIVIGIVIGTLFATGVLHQKVKIKPASNEAGFLLLAINKLDFINFGEVDFHFCGSTKEDGFEFNNFGISVDGENTTFGAF